MSETNAPHLRDDVLAAYLDRRLSPESRAAADVHLAECAACRDDLIAVTELKRTAGRRSPIARLGGPVAAVAAAVLIAVLVPWQSGRQPSADRERARETTTVAGARVRVVAPVDGATLTPDSIRFTWQRESADAGYHLTLTDDSGGVKWAADTPDTSIGLPPALRLDRGRTYYWYVDALSGDGRTRATGLRHFRVAP